MSEVVEILVKIIDQFSSEADKLDRKLRKLDAHRRKSVQIDVDGYNQVSLMESYLDHMARPRHVQVMVSRQTIGGLPVGPHVSLPEIGSPAYRVFRRLHPTLSRVGDAGDVLSHVLSRMNGIVGRLVPSYHLWIAALAAVIPILVVLATAALGYAAALGAVVIAGGALLGFGLVGEGRNMADSWANATASLREFKNELFEVFQPTAQLFSPIAQMFMGTAPARLGGMIEGIEALRVFEDLLNNAFDGLIGFINEALLTMASFRAEIEHINDVLGPAVGSALINFLSFVTREAARDSELILRLGMAFALLLKILYDLSLVLSSVVVVFLPFLAILREITDRLNNKWVVGIITAVASLWMLVAVMRTVTTGIQMVGAGIIWLTELMTVLRATSLSTGLILAGVMGVATAGLAIGAGYIAMKQFEDMANRSMTGYSSPGSGVLAPSGTGIADRGVSSTTYNVVVNTQNGLTAADLEYAFSDFHETKQMAEKPDAV